MQDSLILRKNKDIVTREIEDETLLIPIYKTSDEINCIYRLNDSAAKVWKMFNGKRTLGAIKKQVAKEFVSTSKEIDKGITKLVKELKGIKALVVPANNLNDIG